MCHYPRAITLTLDTNDRLSSWLGFDWSFARFKLVNATPREFADGAKADEDPVRMEKIAVTAILIVEFFVSNCRVRVNFMLQMSA